MRQHRFYVPIELAVGVSCQIPVEKARHMIQVLRLPVGTKVILFNGDGCEYSALLTEVKKKAVIVNILSSKTENRESPLTIHLLQGLSKGERMDFVIQKCTELGVASICPVITARNTVKLNHTRLAKKHTHWQKIIHAACEQSGRNTLPELQQTTNFEAIVRTYATNNVLKLILQPEAGMALRQIPQNPSTVVLLVGAEGGFAPEELALAAQHGFTSLSFGPRILRTETAGLAATAGVQAKWGDI
ncbi:MAG TPA: 16S rRNA (uracil(1498)-N(3))-methyltransferase [Gammaproteobacteria bacterium]|nr:16S rRNA (uracil(1498)-N(3))-methyltransferase [Gammaproteobacteria bacterium]